MDNLGSERDRGRYPRRRRLGSSRDAPRVAGRTHLGNGGNVSVKKLLLVTNRSATLPAYLNRYVSTGCS